MKTIPINTERLILRPIKLTDTEAIFKYRSDFLANKYQSWIPKTIDEVKDFITNRVSPIIDLIDTWFQFVIILTKSQELIGDIGLHFLDTEKKQVEIGCTLDKNNQGKGYATEAFKQTINYLFNDLDKHRIIASIDPNNLKSIGLLKRLNFRKEAHFRKSLFIDGEWVDDIVYAILKSEWHTKKSRKKA